MPKCSEVVSCLIVLQKILKFVEIILVHRICIANFDFWSVCECACVYIKKGRGKAIPVTGREGQ
jgi:hypothetical protein